MLAHTIDETLEKFELVSGAGDGETKACVMTALSWAHGDAWSDRLACANRLLNSAAITANDAETTTAKQKAELVRAGATGILDTWWVPDVVVLWALGQEDAEKPWYERVLRGVNEVAAWKDTRTDVRADLRGADLRDANLGDANLRYADLRYADLRYANLRYANLRYANLGYANLRYANLGYANLRYANLGYADLRYADLRGANYNQLTLWPSDVDPVARGAVKV